ncbi:MAG: glycosyltransferase [Ignavibacteriales bacterium]|nr:glycosyltransferase [Ignavibacteriales bacterium]
MNREKRKIAIVGPAYPYRGGNAMFITQLYFKLRDRFDVKIYNYTTLYPSILFPGKTQYDESGDMALKAPNERLVSSINPFNWFSVAKRLREEDADLVVFNWWQPFFAFCHRAISALVRKRYRGRILFITENVLSHEYRPLEKTLTRVGLKHADSFLALSQAVVEDLEFVRGDRPVRRSELPAYDFCRTDGGESPEEVKRSFGFDADDRVLLFFGYIRKYKGLDILLDAMPAMIERDPSTKLLVGGEFYEDEESYRRKIDELGIGGAVRMVNRFIPNEEVERFFVAADVVLLPYRSATQSAILNMTYSFRKPVVATRVGGFTEFIDDGETGVVVEPNDPAELAKGVAKFYESRERVDYVANIERRLGASEFEKIAELFEEIVAEADERAARLAKK